MEPVEVGARIVDPGLVTIERNGPTRPLPPSGLDPDLVAGLVVETEAWGATTVAEVLERFEARSLVVVHRGGLAFEWYGAGGGPDRLQRCYSVTKSFTGTLAALAMHDGDLDRATSVATLLPELAESGFGDATVADIADMAVSIAYDEDYDAADETTDGAALLGFGDYLVALGLDRPDDAVDVAASIRTFLPRIGRGAGRHGDAFAYGTPVTDVLAWLLERARGASYPQLLAETIWSRVGAEHDASLSLDPNGTPVAGGGLAVTTRDLARFGLLLERGDPDGEHVVPPAVIEAIRDGGDSAVFQRGSHYDYLTGYSYRDQWWMPGGPSRPLSAWGIYGQLLWVDPDAEIVIASHCGGPDPSDQRRDLEQDAMCRALTAASASWA